MSGYYDDGGYDGRYQDNDAYNGADYGYDDEGDADYDQGYERSPLTPDEIERQGFAIEQRGYHRDQVRGFLYEVAAALRLALQGNQSTVFGPPPTWPREPADQAEPPATPELTFENTRILRAHLSASLRQDSDANLILEKARKEAGETLDKARTEADEATRRARAEADTTVKSARDRADDIVRRARDQADDIVQKAQDEANGAIEQTREFVEQHRSDAGGLLRQAEVEAEHLREQARRTLAAAQEEARSVVTDAEARARRVLKGARQDALNHAQQVSTTLEARAEQLVEAEHGTLQRLNEARRELSKVIEELAGAEPVVGPTIEILRLAVDARTTGEPSLTGPSPEPLKPADAGEPADHPVNTMVRAAVARAMDAAVPGFGDDGAGDDLVGPAAEPVPVLETAPPPPPAPAPDRPSPGRRGDLRDLLSELASIVDADGEASRET
jgi:DivIVA domain-containing protein